MKAKPILTAILMACLSAAQAQIHAAQALPMGKPVLVVFFNAGCPHNPVGAKDMNELAKVLGSRFHLEGVVNYRYPDGETYMRKKLGVKFPVYCDAKGALTKRAGAKNSLDIVVLDAKGDQKAYWNGYSRSVLQKAVDLMTKLDGGKRIDLSRTTISKAMQSGCGYVF